MPSFTLSGRTIKVADKYQVLLPIFAKVRTHWHFLRAFSNYSDFFSQTNGLLPSQTIFMLIPRWPKNIAMCSDAPDLDSHYNVKSCTNHGCWYKDFTTLLLIVTFLTISFISFFVPILQIKRKLVYLFDSVNYLFFFLKLFVTRINCYFLLGPFANGEAAPTLIPYIYDPVIKHWPRPDHLEMVRNNIISEICPVYI